MSGIFKRKSDATTLHIGRDKADIAGSAKKIVTILEDTKSQLGEIENIVSDSDYWQGEAQVEFISLLNIVKQFHADLETTYSQHSSAWSKYNSTYSSFISSYKHSEVTDEQ